MSKDILWGYADSKDAYEWIGYFDTKEEAIAAGKEYFEWGRGNVDPFWVRSGNVPPAGLYLPDAEDILDIMNQRAEEDVGSTAVEEFPRVTDKARHELNIFLSAWCETHVKCDFAIFDGEPEYIDGVEGK